MIKERGMDKKNLRIMLLAVAIIGSAWAEDAEPVNLALGAKAKASTTEVGKPDFVADGKLDTRWGSHLNVDPSWIALDLGTPKTFKTVRLYWKTAYATEYDLESSEDGKTWTKFYEQKDGNGNLENITLEKPVTTRYFRFFGKKRGTKFGYAFREIQLFAE
ncbi:MAG: discoidin domain-containing protein [Victivallales bacterium]|nr:discoidin domain-containing protein [Victivallales bacterium]